MRLNRFFEIAILMECGMGVVAVLLAWPFGLRLWDYFSFDLASFGLSVAATGITIPVYFVLRVLPFDWLRQMIELVRTIYRNEMQSLPVWKLALIALAAGFGEELLFRGLLQQGLCNLFPGKELIVIVVVSLLFGLAHCLTKMYVVLAFLISLYLGLLFFWTGNLLVPLLVHALYDFFVFCHLHLECRADQ